MGGKTLDRVRGGDKRASYAVTHVLASRTITAPLCWRTARAFTSHWPRTHPSQLWTGSSLTCSRELCRRLTGETRGRRRRLPCRTAERKLGRRRLPRNESCGPPTDTSIRKTNQEHLRGLGRPWVFLRHPCAVRQAGSMCTTRCLARCGPEVASLEQLYPDNGKQRLVAAKLLFRRPCRPDPVLEFGRRNHAAAIRTWRTWCEVRPRLLCSDGWKRIS